MNMDFMTPSPNSDEEVFETPTVATTASDYLDEDNPKSMYSLASARIKTALDMVSPKYFESPESELQDKLQPDQTLSLLRFRLHQEYAFVLSQGKGKLTEQTIAKGICTVAYFNNRILKNSLATAWLFTPPHDYLELANRALIQGMDRLSQILNMPIYTKDGKPDTKVASLILKAISMMDQRVHGAPTQRHEVKSMSITQNTTLLREVDKLVEEANMDEIEAQLQEVRGAEEKEVLLLEAEPKYSEFKSGGIDVEPKKVKTGIKTGGREF